MKRNRFPPNLILGNIVIHTTILAHARLVKAIARVELAKQQVTSGIVNLDGLHISWSVLSHSRANWP